MRICSSPYLWRLSGMIDGACVVFVAGSAAGAPLLVVIGGLDWLGRIWRDAYFVVGWLGVRA